MKYALALAFVLAPSLALADEVPSLELVDRGPAIEIIAHNVKAVRTAVTPTRSRLEVELVGNPHAQALPSGKGIVTAELDGHPRMLTVKLPFERTDVKTLARYAQAIQVGNDLHLMFPRAIPAEGAAVVLPEATLPPAIAAKADTAIGPQPKAPPVVETKPAVKPEVVAAITTPAPIGKPDDNAKQPEKPTDKSGEGRTRSSAEGDAKSTDKSGEGRTRSSAEGDAKSTDKSGEGRTRSSAEGDAKSIDKKFLAEPESTSNLGTYAMFGLGAIGIGAWMVKRKKTAQKPAHSTIEVIAQRSLGAKARVVWFTAGGREMVVAVTPQMVRMLGQWKKSDSDAASVFPAAALPEAQAFEAAPRESRQTMQRAATSPSVAGIMKLRQRQSQVYEAVSEDVATGDLDADALWAKEIMAATGSRR